MSVNLKVNVVEQNTTKVMRFAENMSIHEVCKAVIEKTGIGGKDHGIFQPNHEGETCVGRWLRPERTLEYYDLKSNDVVDYRKKHDTITIKLVDDTTKKVLVDLSQPVAEILQIIGKKIALKNADEFSLQAENKPGEWLKNQVTIPEQVTSLDQAFLMRKKFFMNDANLDQDDPVQLHLVYCQSRDDVVSGLHPVSKEEAVQFAALQAQIQLGDYKPDVHRPGTINLKDFFAPDHQKKEFEKILFSEWKKLVGMNETNTRYRYVQLCRSLKTYGMTVYHVKERHPTKKNKLIDGLLCFTRSTIIRMEAENKRVIKEYPFKHLMRWAATPETFTLDFGSYEEDYVVVVTTEGEAISALLAGYIDLLLKKQRDTGVVIGDDDNDVGAVSTIARVGGAATSSITTSSISGPASLSQGANDCATGAKALDRMLNELYGEIASVNDNNLTPMQRKQQIEGQAKTLMNLAEMMETLAKSADRTGMNQAAHKIAASTEQMILAARQAAAVGIDPEKLLLDATKGITDSLKLLLAAAQNVANKPNDPEAKEALLRAQAVAQANLQKIGAISRGVFADDGFQALFKELARAVVADSQELIAAAAEATAKISDPIKKQQLQAAAATLGSTQDHFISMADILAPTVQDPQCRNAVERSGKALEQTAQYVVATAKAAGSDPAVQQHLTDSLKKMVTGLQNLFGVAELPNIQGTKEADEFAEAAQAVLQASAAIMASEGNAEVIKHQAAELKNAVAKLGQTGKAIISDPRNDQKAKERLATYLNNVVQATKKVLGTVPSVLATPGDAINQKKLEEAAQEVAETTHQLLGDLGKQVAIAALFSSAKAAAAATTKLCTASVGAGRNVNDNSARQQLGDATKAAAEAVQKLVGILRNVNEQTGPSRRTISMRGRAPTMSSAVKDDLMTGSEQFAPVAFKLVSAAKAHTGKVTDQEASQELTFASNNAAKAIHKLLATRKTMKAVKGQLETGEALEEFKAAETDLEGAMISADTGILQRTMGKDEALAALNQTLMELGNINKQLVSTAKSSPEDIGGVMKKAAEAMSRAVTNATALAATLEDKNVQKALLAAVRAVANQTRALMQIANAVAANPDDPNLAKLLLNASQAVADALGKLAQAAQGIVPKKVEDFHSKSSADIEDLAEKELINAASAIERCVAKLTAASQSARQRATENGISIDEQNITEAILEAAQAIAKSTAVLVTAATSVQQEYQKLVKEPKTGNVYKRDPQWAQGLISAAQNVAATVQHLVQAANSAAQGNASEEALIVAANAVSAATAQLVTASTVKTNPNSQNQSKLKDASSRVSHATSLLVNAAKNAAKWEEEQAALDQEDKYNLTANKIKEMEQQMAILRLEKELEKARSNLSTMRKNEYTAVVDPNFRPGVPAPNGSSTATATTTTATAPPAVPNRPALPPRSNIQWKQTGFNGKK